MNGWDAYADAVHAEDFADGLKREIRELKDERDALIGDAKEADEARRLAEAEVGKLREAIEEYSLWEPGRAGHAAAHRKLLAALAEKEQAGG